MASRRCFAVVGYALVWSAILAAFPSSRAAESNLQPLLYNHPGLVVDLGVGLWAWPLPMDYDGDGDTDLVVSCPDVPFNGIYWFENPGGEAKLPVFKPPRRVADGLTNVQVSYVDGEPRVLAPGRELLNFRQRSQPASPQDMSRPLGIAANFHTGKIRANQWKYVDYDGDGAQDLIIGIGDWTDYGWDNAFNAAGEWTRGDLHGFVYLARNTGSNDEPAYATPVKLEAGGRPVDVFGMPSPNFADFDGDGDLDLLCGEFLDGFTYFANTGTRTQPTYAAGRRLEADGRPLVMDLQMITPTAMDWDRDGDWDLIVGDEDGRVALVEHTGEVRDGVPQFRPPVYFQQEAERLKFGALATPTSCDWDADGDEDLICGNTAGYIAWIENLDGGCPPRWAPPQKLSAGGEVIRIQAGPNGSIQGPCEAKWGYTTVAVADLDNDGRLDVIANSIWGKVVWFQNVGTRAKPVLAAARPLAVDWPGEPPHPAWNWWKPQPTELATQWRTTPAVCDWNRDGCQDLVMLDHEGFLALWAGSLEAGQPSFAPPQRCFQGTQPGAFDSLHRPKPSESTALQMNDGQAGASGRRKLCVADWDGDGRWDLLVNSRCVNFLRNVRDENGLSYFDDLGLVDDARLAGHTTSPTTVDWDRDGRPELVIGAEDGHFYYLRRP